jgi:hypothetical protein
MLLNLLNRIEKEKAKLKLEHFIKLGKTIELKALSDKRTSLQNRALHKFFVLISSELNELGLEFQFFGVKGQVLSTRYTANIVKNFFWRPIQMALFDIESTKDLDTKKMNNIIDVIVKYFGDMGVFIEFPNRELLDEV